jgi:cytochrome d ubiquinol oxidase subunit I
MNDPQGFRLVGGRVLDPDPIAAMFNPATPVQSAHMIIAAIMVTGYLVAAVHALGLLRGRRGPGQRAAFLIPFTLAAVFTPAQIVVGDAAARYVADRQPVKLAAMEAQVSTEIGPAEHVGGVVVDGRLRYAIVIPHGLSLLLTGRTDTRVSGLDAVPVDQRPPVNVVHLAFDLMVGIGTALLVLGAWLGVTWGRRRDLPRSRWFLRAAVLAGPAAVAALEAGWVTTEVGRQPWIVYRVMRTADAVNTAPGLAIGLVVLVGVYTVLTVSTVYVLRRQGPVASA